jgi:AAA domain
MVERVRSTQKREVATRTPGPSTYTGDLANIPAEMTGQSLWAIWQWTPRENSPGSFSKPPRQAKSPDYPASTKMPGQWSTFKAARKAVDGKRADGVSFNLLDSGLGALDLDHCRDPIGQLDDWAQNIIDQAERLGAYVEVTPSGTGLRVIGRATGKDTNRKFPILGSTNGAAVEVFRNTPKAIAVTGARLAHLKPKAKLPNIDKMIDDTVARCEAEARIAPKTNGAAGATDYSGDVDWDTIVSDGAPAGEDRSWWFNRCVWHFAGIGFDLDAIIAEFEAHPDGVAGRYIAQGRLDREVERCFTKWQAENPGAISLIERKPPTPREKVPVPLPPMFMHGEVDPLTSRNWLVKGLLIEVGTGLLAGQWGTYKTFMLLELAAAVMTGQPFMGRFRIKRQSGVLLIAAEGAAEVPLRLEAVVREKCGIERAPFVWYEKTPLLLQADAAKTLVAMALQAEERLQEQFKLPLGLIIIDTLIVASGYTKPGDENDSAIGQRIMSVLKAVADQTRTFVLGVDHFGKHIETGTRGTSVKETDADCVLALLGKEDDGRVVDPRLNTRKVRGARSGEEFPFTVRPVDIGIDDDGEPLQTLVIEWEDATTRRAPGLKLTPREARLFHLLVEAVTKGPHSKDPRVPAGELSITREAAKAHCKERGWWDSEKEHISRSTFSRLVNFLDDKGAIGLTEDHIWIKQKERDR